MEKSQGLSIVLPVYNEEKNIKPVIEDILSNIKKFTSDYEIIVVDDGSKDKTLNILYSLKERNKEIKIITHKENRGYGAALTEGIKHANKEFILLMDADGQFRINSLCAFWDKRHSYDFILGYRKERRDNIYRKIMGRIGNYIADLLLKKNIKDINCGFKLFKAKILKRLNLESRGGIISFEILYKLFKINTFSFLQIPVEHYERKFGNPGGGKIKVIIKIILEFTKLILKDPL